jgi:hypothetical protein
MAGQSPTSKYTSTAEKQCRVLEEHEQGASFKMLCRGCAPYEVIHEGYDGRSWLSLRYRGRDIDLHGSTMRFAPGAFPAKTNDVVEWRGLWHGADFVPYALIYRMSRTDPVAGREYTRLIVLRLAGEKSSVIGYAEGGDEDTKAKRMADKDHFHERR